MERAEAVTKLRSLIGKDIRQLATVHDVTVWKNKKINKGWAGHVIERHLGLPINSAQAPNFGSWELKIVPLKKLKSGEIVPKETMAITMIDPVNVLQTPFEKSHLLLKLKKLVICARMFESKAETQSILLRVGAFDLSDIDLLSVIRKDYEDVRRAIKDAGFQSLTGKMGTLVQPRTKGAGHGSTSRAFYARKALVRRLLNLQ